jgi:GNAT superfamily N-acetyltransferase
MSATVTTIRPMLPGDADPAADAVIRGDWGDRRAFFHFASAHPECRPFVAVDAGGAVAGTGVATINGPVGWVGTIYVVPELRGAGVGKALTAAVIDALEEARCATLVLVATDLGRPVYERLGFAVQTRYRILEHDGSAVPAGQTEDEAIRPFGPTDVPTASVLDRAATGEDRRHLLEAFADEPGSWALEGPEGSLRAFLVRPPWGGGATIAPAAEDAVRLLDHRRRLAGPQGRVRAGLLDENVQGFARLDEAGWREAWSAVRMIRGQPLDWSPGQIWGQFNHALG